MNNFDLKIRGCHRNDLDDICRIEEACYGAVEALHRIAMTQYFDLWGYAFGVAETSSQVIGFAVGGLVLNSDIRLGWLLDVAILPNFQQHKVGQAVSGYVLDKLKKAGATRIHATVAPENDRSLKMLRRLGFNVIDDVPDYFGYGQRRLLMESHCEV